MDSMIKATNYMAGVRVELERPRLDDNHRLDGPEQLVVFGVTRFYNDLLEEGITVVLTPSQAIDFSRELDRVLMRSWGLNNDDS